MSSFEETLARMKSLYTYGQEINEDKQKQNCTLEFHKQGADGVFYGIVKECSKYYIKSAPKGKETIAEAYDYLGGFCNRKNYEYTSYSNAMKNLKLKLGSINEAHDSNVQTGNVDSFKKTVLMTEATEKMQQEIARQRQIMYNVSMLMNESSEFHPNMFNGKNPEAETGKSGDEDYTKTDAKPEFDGKKTSGVDKKAEPFKETPTTSEDQLKEGCDCGDGKCNCGWENWNCTSVDGNPGVGEADTDHNNDPFVKNVNEEEDFDDEEITDVEETEPETDDDIDIDGIGDDELPEDGEDELPTDGDEDDIPMDGEDDVPMDSEDDMPIDGEDDMPIDGEDDMPMDDELGDDIEGESDLELSGDEDLSDDELGDNEEPDFGFEDGDDDFDSEHETDINFDDEDDVPMDDEFPTDDEDDMPIGDDDEFDGDIEECGFEECGNNMMESKQRKMNMIVENVVKKILAEDELHVFGKHPGYRKKPFTLPTTGEDKNQWGEDWNDESVYSEEPFGSKIGDSTPFDELVDNITNDIMYQLKTGEAFKKKTK